MIWGVHPDWHQDGDNRSIDSEIQRLDPHATTLLGYNEPDGQNPGQSNIDVSAVRTFKSYGLPLQGSQVMPKY